ncbi:hemophore-related protein [Mycolicibacterium arenosum]|uniref:Heme-binding protein n=1 Tax=Mycolicibacterium arenosum TaxID=2952157 RepID=A0ABT1LYA0_9MYCO|nr:hemophore-related protein [Mycolicibacterium sp. CAU 1645]MCP9271320.1 heme-binding protein [Mycolicibacterium sp. CAU 1645]
MTRAANALALLAAGSAAVLLSLPSAAAEPTDPVEPADPTVPTAPAQPSTAPLPGPAPEATAAADDCTAAGLASTISSVTAELSTYFAAHPDVNQAMIDATRQPSFIAVGQFDDFFKNHPVEADAIRAIQAPYVAFKDRCGLQVAPTDALAVLAEV